MYDASHSLAYRKKSGSRVDATKLRRSNRHTVNAKRV